MKNWNVEKIVLWAVYLALLGVLLPHTAWAFGKFELADGQTVSWLAAFAFEAIIAAFTHRLARHIELVPDYEDTRRRFRERYLNAYSFGLSVALLVSFLANLAHAIEFGSPLAVFAGRGSAFAFYALAFGGVLPAMSFLFARVLSNTEDRESAFAGLNAEIERLNNALDEVNETVADVNAELSESKQARQASEQKAADLETALNDTRAQLAAMETELKKAVKPLNGKTETALRLFGEDKQERIKAAYESWPELPQRSLAIIAESSAAYVNKTLANGNH